jgi:hypothetical protein
MKMIRKYIYQPIYKKKGMLKKSEIEKLMQSNLEFISLTKSEKEELEVETGLASVVATSTASEIIHDYYKTQAVWSIYLKAYIQTEDYAFAALLRDMIRIEELEALRIVTSYYSKEDKEEVLNEIKMVRHHMRKEFNY